MKRSVRTSQDTRMTHLGACGDRFPVIAWTGAQPAGCCGRSGPMSPSQPDTNQHRLGDPEAPGSHSFS